MAREVVSQTLPELDGRQMWTVDKVTLKRTFKKTPVNTMNPKGRAIGFFRAIPEFSADLEVVYEAANPEVDWKKLQREHTSFLLTCPQGGKRTSLVDCEVEEVSEPFDSNGETKIAVTIKALDEREG